MKKYFIILILSSFLSCSGGQCTDNKNSSEDPDIQIETFDARKKYSDITKDIIASVPDSDLEQVMVDYVYDRVIEGNDAGSRAAFKKLSPGFRAVYSTLVLEELVRTEGFAQYFSEPEGLYIEGAVEGFSLLGAPVLSRIARTAMLLSREGGSSVADIDKFSELDDEFIKNSGPAGNLRIKYIRNHPSMFYTKD